MGKLGNQPQEEGKLDNFGGRDNSTMEEHEGPYIHGHDDGPVKGRAWHGMKKPHKIK
jgi:hypothetical protein